MSSPRLVNCGTPQGNKKTPGSTAARGWWGNCISGAVGHGKGHGTTESAGNHFCLAQSRAPLTLGRSPDSRIYALPDLPILPWKDSGVNAGRATRIQWRNRGGISPPSLLNLSVPRECILIFNRTTGTTSLVVSLPPPAAHRQQRRPRCLLCRSLRP